MRLKVNFSGVLTAHLATLFFGLAGLFAKWVDEPSIVIVFGRVFFATLTLFSLIKGFKGKLKPLSSRDGLFFLFLGLLLAFHWLAFFQAIKVSTVAIGLLAYSTFPVFTSIFEPLWLKTTFRFFYLLAAMLCLLGVFFLIPSLDPHLSIFQGVLWGVLAGFSFSLLTIANRLLTKRYSSLTIAFYQDAGATLFLFPLMITRYSIPETSDLLKLAFLGVFCTAGAHSLFIHGMKKISASSASIISSLEPVYGIILAYLFLREIPSLRTLIGGLIILFSVMLVSLSSQRKFP